MDHSAHTCALAGGGQPARQGHVHPLEGVIVAVQDGVGRQYRLELKTLAGLATEASGGWGG